MPSLDSTNSKLAHIRSITSSLPTKVASFSEIARMEAKADSLIDLAKSLRKEVILIKQEFTNNKALTHV